jgi:hypothetical protein
MKKYVLLIVFSSLLMLGCKEKPRSESQQTVSGSQSDSTVAIGNEKVHLSISKFRDVLETDFTTFEVDHYVNYDDRKGWFSSSKDKGSDGEICWNLIFYNTKTRNHYLLEPNKKMLIYEYDLNDTLNGKVRRNFARYDIQFDDNNDGKFTDSDAKRLFVSDRLGKAFHQVSPEGFHVQDYEFSPKDNFLIINGLKDTNKDGVYSEKDQSYVYRLDLSQEAEKITLAQPLLSKDFHDMLLKKIETDWKLPNQ